MLCEAHIFKCAFSIPVDRAIARTLWIWTVRTAAGSRPPTGGGTRRRRGGGSRRSAARGAAVGARAATDIITISDEEEELDKENMPVPARHVRRRVDVRPAEDVIELSESD